MDFTHFKSYLELAAAFVFGAVTLFGIFNSRIRGMNKDNDQVAKDLIDNLKIKVDLQKETIEDVSRRLEQTTKELHIQVGRNQVLESLFNGKENSIMSFLQMVPELVTVTKATNESVGLMASSMKALIDKMGPSSMTVSVTKP